MVERNIDHISALVADLLNYARDRRPDLEPLDPNELVADVLETLRPKAEAQGAVFKTRLDPAASPWMLDAHTMHQCLMNLVTNALDATAAIDGAWVRISTLVSDEGELEIRVQDNGQGLAANLTDSLFSSMVTTKRSKGTGLRLLVVHKIVAEHGGSVCVDGEMAPGATFRVFIPRDAGERAAESLAFARRKSGEVPSPG
jgi:signal transduction histidine kinase